MVFSSCHVARTGVPCSNQISGSSKPFPTGLLNLVYLLRIVKSAGLTSMRVRIPPALLNHNMLWLLIDDPLYLIVWALPC